MNAGGIRIVLVGTSHPGNIGAAVRAMKNMALSELVLVNPRHFPHPEALARASGAADMLAAVRVVPTLDRDQYFRVVDVREAASRLVAESNTARAAVVFGPERSGLSNEELESAHALIRIPASPAYASLNLAMAVQLVAYELYRARGVACLPAAPLAAPLASTQEMERLYGHIAAVLEEIDFRDRTQSGTHLMGRIRRLLQRAELDQNEVNILRGILTAVQNRRRTAGGAAR